jgi:putative SOS response-associated peptidase YedK
MPAVIAPGNCQTWLAGDVKDAVTLSRPAPDGTFSLTPVSIARPGKPSARINLFDV